MSRVWGLKIVVLELEQGGLRGNGDVDEVEEVHLVFEEEGGQELETVHVVLHQ